QDTAERSNMSGHLVRSQALLASCQEMRRQVTRTLEFDSILFSASGEGVVPRLCCCLEEECNTDDLCGHRAEHVGSNILLLDMPPVMTQETDSMNGSNRRNIESTPVVARG